MKACKFQLHIEAREPIILPPYKGSTLRGGFGNAFKKVVCALKTNDCADCILKEQCVYSYVFETPPPKDAKVMRKYEAAPHPFIIEPPLEKRMGYKPGDGLTFGLTLIGRAIDYLPYFIYTFAELGNMGLGKGRGKYTLREVYHVRSNHRAEAAPADGGRHSRAGGNPGPYFPADLLHDLPVPPGHICTQIYSSDTKKLTAFEPEGIAIALSPPDAGDGQTQALRINFLTPARLYYDGRLINDLEFHILIRQLLRRISMLAYFHCGIDTSSWDFKGLIDKAKDISTKEKNLRWYDWQRYSARQEQKINMGGFVGDITYEGNLAPFLPLIRAGESLHVGKGATFGLGRYEMLIHEELNDG